MVRVNTVSWHLYACMCMWVCVYALGYDVRYISDNEKYLNSNRTCLQIKYNREAWKPSSNQKTVSQTTCLQTWHSYRAVQDPTHSFRTELNRNVERKKIRQLSLREGLIETSRPIWLKGYPLQNFLSQKWKASLDQRIPTQISMYTARLQKIKEWRDAFNQQCSVPKVGTITIPIL